VFGEKIIFNARIACAIAITAAPKVSGSVEVQGNNIIAADADGLDVPGNGFNGFIKMTQSNLGKWMNKNEPNDLFAPVHSLQCHELWEGRKAEHKIPEPISNHHFGYFITPPGTRDVNTIWKVLSEVI